MDKDRKRTDSDRTRTDRLSIASSCDRPLETLELDKLALLTERLLGRTLGVGAQFVQVVAEITSHCACLVIPPPPHDQRRLRTEQHFPVLVRFGGQHYGTLYVAPSVEHASLPAIAPALAQRLAHTCGLLLYILEQAALAECLRDYPSIGPSPEPPTAPRQEAFQASFASTEHACPAGLLTRRERQVLALMAHGYSVPAIAQGLQVAVGTVGKHQENIYGKLGVHSPIDAILTAHRSGIIRYISADG